VPGDPERRVYVEDPWLVPDDAVPMFGQLWPLEPPEELEPLDELDEEPEELAGVVVEVPELPWLA
jgi:hypothetical protein